MGSVDVLLERFFLFLEGLSSHIANIAIIFLIVLKLVGLISQTTKGVQHDTRDDIGKHGSKENTINRIISKSDHLKRLHGLANGSRNIESQDTLHHCLA